MVQNRHTVAAASSAGRRSGQEDAHLILPLSNGALVAVADGMGGHAAGEVASRLAVEALERTAKQLDGTTDPVALLQSAARKANQAILDHAKARPDVAGLGTTLVVAVVQGNRLFLGHAGDSRAWLLNGDDVGQLTRDHTAVQDAIDRGELDLEEAKHSPYRNAILRNLGDAEYQGLDVSSPPGGWMLQPGTVVLLTSDGAHGALTEADLLEHSAGTPDLQSALESLMRLAYARGSDDNITLAACEFGALPRSRHRVAAAALIPHRSVTTDRNGSKTQQTRRLVTGLCGVLLLLLVGLAVLVVREASDTEVGLGERAGKPDPVREAGPSSTPADVHETLPAVETPPTNGDLRMGGEAAPAIESSPSLPEPAMTDEGVSPVDSLLNMDEGSSDAQPDTVQPAGERTPNTEVQ